MSDEIHISLTHRESRALARSAALFADAFEANGIQSDEPVPALFSALMKLETAMVAGHVQP